MQTPRMNRAANPFRLRPMSCGKVRQAADTGIVKHTLVSGTGKLDRASRKAHEHDVNTMQAPLAITSTESAQMTGRRESAESI